MSDSCAKTRYRVAQHWRFRTETPEAKDTLVVTAVEDHPAQGIICGVRVEYDPPFQSSPNSFVSGGEYWFTQDALDASVTDLVAEKGLFPRHLGTTGEFRRDAESWGQYPHPTGDTRTVGEAVAVGIGPSNAPSNPFTRLTRISSGRSCGRNERREACFMGRLLEGTN